MFMDRNFKPTWLSFLAQAHGYDLTPPTFQLDFDQSAHNAIRTVFPHARSCICVYGVAHRKQDLQLTTPVIQR